MKSINLDTYSELISECLELFEANENITIIADEELATELLQVIDLDNFEDTIINFVEGVDTYLIGKVGDNFFGIETAIWTEGKNVGNYKYNESECVIIFEDIDEDLEFIKEFYEGEYQTIIVSYDEYDLEDLEDDDEDFEDDFEGYSYEPCICEENELKELIDDIYDEIDCECENCIKNAILEGYRQGFIEGQKEILFQIRKNIDDVLFDKE